MEAGTAIPVEKRDTPLFNGKVTLYRFKDCKEPFNLHLAEKTLDVIENKCYNERLLILPTEGFQSFSFERTDPPTDGSLYSDVLIASAFSEQQCRKVDNKVANVALSIKSKQTQCMNVPTSAGAHSFSFRRRT
jgi:DUF1365 family protein